MIGWRSKTPTAAADKPKGFDDFDLRLGDLMRGERATLGRSLLDVQRDLRIKASYIAAIENADVSAFESPGFIAGYVRAYARYLGMDPEMAFQKFCAEANFKPSHGLSPAASATGGGAASRVGRGFDDGALFANPNAAFIPQREAILSRIEPGALGSFSVLLAVVAAVGYGGWMVLQEVQRVHLAPVDQTPVVVTQIDPLVPAAPPAASDSDPVSLASRIGEADPLERLYEPKALDVPVLNGRDGPIAAINPDRMGSAREALVAGSEAGQVQVVAAPADQVEVLAVRPAWVQVSSADGTVLFEKILDAGERYTVPPLEVTPLLRSGNSGSIYFVVAGKTYGPAAPGAKVVKDVALSAQNLASAYQLADPASDPELGKFAEAGPEAQPQTAPIPAP